MIFVDASAIIAIMTREPSYKALIAALESSKNAITSSIAVFEAVAGLCRKDKLSVEDARSSVDAFLTLCGIEILPITVETGKEALAAFDRFGKGQGHPAQLNLSDCFAYAAAKGHKAALLFTGNDFSATDIPAAVQSSPSLSDKME